MKATIRPSTPADAPAIGALFAERGMRHYLDPQFLNWKYWQPRNDWPGTRSFVLAHDSELIAHAAIVPGACVWAGQRMAMTHMIDWAARAGSGAGVSLLKYLGRMTQMLLGVGGAAETLSILPHLGFRQVGTVSVHARPLFPLRLLRSGATWKLLPKLARAAWRRSPPAAPGGTWRSRRLAGDDILQIASVLPRPAEDMAVTERSVGLFRYALSCPGVPLQLYAVEQAGRVRGYFLLVSVAGQIRIADYWIDSPESSDWRALILCAVEQAQHDPHAAEVVAWASDARLAAALRSCGFYPRIQYPIQVRAATRDALPGGTLRVQMLDNDAPYLWQSHNEYWG